MQRDAHLTLKGRQDDGSVSAPRELNGSTTHVGRRFRSVRLWAAFQAVFKVML